MVKWISGASLSALLLAATSRAAPATTEGSPSADATQAVASGAGSSERGRVDAAQAMFARGLDSIGRKRWADAEAWFERSVSIIPRASSLYNLAMCRFRLGRPSESLETIDRLLDEFHGEGDARYRSYAEELRTRALTLVVVLRIAVDPPNARLTVDGAERNESGADRTVFLAPGLHRIEGAAEGYSSIGLVLEGWPGQTLERRLTLVPQPSPVQSARASRLERTSPVVRSGAPGPDRHRAGADGGVKAHWVTLATGAALLVGAATTGAVAWSADRDFVDACPSLKQCSPSSRPLEVRAHDWAIASDVLLGLGLATVGVGAALWVGSGSTNVSDRGAAVAVRVPVDL